MLKGIVFDLDGTLVDSMKVTIDAFNHGITQNGGKHHSAPEIMKYFGPGEDEIFTQIVGQERAEKAYADMRAYLAERLGQVPLFEGVIDLFRELRERQIPMSIFTGRSWNTTELILRHHGILDEFVTVVANDHVDFPKPSPEGLRICLDRMNLKPQEIAYVGDLWVDVRAALSAGSTAVAALWDVLAKRENFKDHPPHHFMEHPSHLLTLFGTKI